MPTDEATQTWVPGRPTAEVEFFRASFESDLGSGVSVNLGDWLERVPPKLKSDVFVELLLAEVQFRQKNGFEVDPSHYLVRFPDFDHQIRSVFDLVKDQAAGSSHSISMISTSRPTRVLRESKPPPKSWSAGQTVGRRGRYRLDKFVGRGGFGEVWKGFDADLDRVVAIKVPRHKTSNDSHGSLTFREEARRAAKVKHPGIVEIHDVGEVDTGFFIISEFIDGPTLAQRIKSGPVSRATAVRIVREIALILDKAHRDGLFHRDIKPSNILMREEESPVITDFGLAVSEEEQLSLKPGVVGTFVYMSPEQARGETRLLDGRSDLYSLGVILYQMLTGRFPFQYRTDSDLLEQILHREVRPLRSINDTIPARLDEICLKCLSKDVRNRYATGQDLAADLDGWIQSDSAVKSVFPQPLTAQPVPGVSPQSFWTVWRTLSVLVALVLVGIAGMTIPRLPGSLEKPPSGEGNNSPPIKAAAALPAASPHPWLPLLDEPLIRIAAAKAHDTDFLQQDVSKATLTARAEEIFWVLGTRHEGKSPLRIRGRVFMDDWIGTVGFVWSISQSADEFPKAPPRCYACVLERHLDVQPLLLSFREVKTQEFFSDVVTVGQQTIITTKEVAIPKTPSTLLEVVVDQQGLRVLIDKQVVWTPEIFDSQVLQELQSLSGQVGIMVRGKTVVVSDAAVQF